MAGEIEILGTGTLYGLYRPKVEEKSPDGPQDIQRFFLILKFGKTFSKLALGKKRMPVEKSHRLEYAFVENATENQKDLVKWFEEKNYETATQGKRHLPAVRANAEGKFILFSHRNVAHLAFELENQEMGSNQEDVDLPTKAEYVISIKNPNHDGDKGLPKEERAKYSETLQKAFGDYKFIPLPSLDYLRYPGAEVLLIDDKANFSFDTEEVKKALASVTHEPIEEALKLKRAGVSKEPMKTGDWQ